MPFTLTAEEVANIRVLGIVFGLILTGMGFILNAFALYRNVKSRKLTNYQEITKSHRELWKLTIDDPEKYGRILEDNVSLKSHPLSYAEIKFVQLLILHITSAYNFSKQSEMVEIEKLKADVDELLSLPIPRRIWNDSKKYHNKDFVKFVDRRSKRGFFSNRKSKTEKKLNFKKTWNVLVLSAYPERLLNSFIGSDDRFIFRNDLDTEITGDYIVSEDINYVICFCYGKILKKSVINSVTIINVHPGFLPYNRGPNPNLWAFLNSTPKGATIHYIDEGIDTGDIISQEKADYSDIENLTLQSAFDRTIDICVDLFHDTWPKIRCGKNDRTPQPSNGTYHTMRSQKPFQDMFDEHGLNLPIDEFLDVARSKIQEARSKSSR